MRLEDLDMMTIFNVLAQQNNLLYSQNLHFLKTDIYVTMCEDCPLYVWAMKGLTKAVLFTFHLPNLRLAFVFPKSLGS